MKQLERLVLFALAAAFTALGVAPIASATTLEVGGVAKNESVTVKASFKPESSALLGATSGFFANTCTASTIEGKTTAITGAVVSGPLSVLSFGACTEEPIVVDAPGSLSVTNIAGTTNGTVRSIGAKITSPSPYGNLICTTAASPGTDFGTLTGVSAGSATIALKVILNCGFFMPSAGWEGTYVITSPAGLGATS